MKRITLGLLLLLVACGGGDSDYMPVAKDFTLKITEVRRNCFDELGCNVSYEVDVAKYRGEEVDDDRQVTVVYRVLGGEDGPQKNSLRINGDGTYVRDVEHTSLPKDGKLTIEVVEVR